MARKFIPFKAKKPVTPAIKPMSTFEMEDIFCNNVTIERIHPTTLVAGMYKLNEEMVADKKNGTITHEFTKQEADIIAAVEFVCLN